VASSPPRPAVTADDVQRARGAIVDVAKRTPVLPSLTLSQRLGADVTLKAESLQRTGSFKLRGALNKLASLGADCARGVTAGSAGNHAWALAQAATARGVPCEVFMPAEAPLSKVEGCSALGATVHRCGTSVEECVAAARERAREAGSHALLDRGPAAVDRRAERAAALDLRERRLGGHEDLAGNAARHGGLRERPGVVARAACGHPARAVLAQRGELVQRAA